MDRIERIRQSFITKKIEETDTHGYIDRHDPEFHKQNKKSRDDWQDHDEDLTDISIESIIIFLEGLKRENNNLPAEQKKPINSKMKQAISAYDHEEQTARKRYTYLDEYNQEIDLSTVYSLITELNIMLDKGLEHISLIPAEGFLDSIEKTVEKYKGL